MVVVVFSSILGRITRCDDKIRLGKTAFENCMWFFTNCCQSFYPVFEKLCTAGLSDGRIRRLDIFCAVDGKSFP